MVTLTDAERVAVDAALDVAQERAHGFHPMRRVYVQIRVNLALVPVLTSRETALALAALARVGDHETLAGISARA